jgi:hypothetical protein
LASIIVNGDFALGKDPWLLQIAGDNVAAFDVLSEDGENYGEVNVTTFNEPIYPAFVILSQYPILPSGTGGDYVIHFKHRGTAIRLGTYVWTANVDGATSGEYIGGHVTDVDAHSDSMGLLVEEPEPPPYDVTQPIDIIPVGEQFAQVQNITITDLMKNNSYNVYPDGEQAYCTIGTQTCRISFDVKNVGNVDGSLWAQVRTVEGVMLFPTTFKSAVAGSSVNYTLTIDIPQAGVSLILEVGH